jgi:hypothetical protein
MADIQEIISDLPGLKDMSATARQKLTDLASMEIAGAHRWPFLLTVQRTLTWAATDAVQKFPGVKRIWSIMYPDPTSGAYYRLMEYGDIDFQSFIEQNPSHTVPAIWRDAGMDGNEMQVEIYPVPAASTTIKVDYTDMPTNIDALPKRLHSLVISRMMAMVGNYGAKVAYDTELIRAISREMDLQGKRSHVGKDAIQSARMRSINSPS